MELFHQSDSLVKSCDLPQVTHKPKFTVPEIYRMGQHVEDEIQFEDEDLLQGDNLADL